MHTRLQILSEEERHQIHERTLRVLAQTGVRVDTAQGRQILRDAGAEVGENTCVVRFPRALVEESLRLAPKTFTLGARRPGWDLHMNAGDCALVVDGQAVYILDWKTGERRPGTFDGWLTATRLIDAVDEIGLYWPMVENGVKEGGKATLITYWRHLFSNFSKHVQDSVFDPVYVPWLLEVLQIVFGDKETIRREHPLSLLLCPQSPLVIEGPYTDAYLALAGWDIPVTCMPMPLMGATGPGSMMGTIIQGNCEVLAMLCLLQAAAPGTPFIYAPVLAMMDPRSGRYSGGAIGGHVMGAAGTEMARYYNLPAQSSGMGTDHHVPGIQASYERSMGLLTALSWPDILVGVGLLGGSMNLCFEQLIIDVEVFRMFRQAHRGVSASDDKWLDDVIGRVGPAGNYLGERSTKVNVRSGEWYLSGMGEHDTYEAWDSAGRVSLLEEAHEVVETLLATHEPLPLDDDAARALDDLQRAAESEV